MGRRSGCQCRHWERPTAWPKIAVGMLVAVFVLLSWYDLAADASSTQHALRLLAAVAVGISAYAAIMGRAGAAALGR